MGNPSVDRAGVIAPPPLINLAFLVVGLGLNRIVPLAIHPAARIPGIVLMGVAVAVMMFSLRAMKRAATNVSPYKPTTAIIATGPYGYSRNPIYVAFGVLYIGVALALSTLWPLALFPILILFMSHFVIAREERYLEGKFGGEYLAYKSKVRRWL